jgi:thymidylate synthase (FAD)
LIKATYIDHMGDDLSVVNAARVSFGKKSAWEAECHRCGSTKGCCCCSGVEYKLKTGDRKLIKYLSDHGHLSPFNHCFATFHVKAPIFVARQLQKHEYMPWNEISRRYVDSEPEFYTPDVWRGRSKDKKQGSDPSVEIDGESVLTEGTVGYTDVGLQELSVGLYKDALRKGVAPEQARMVLPQSMMTEWYWSGSLGAFAKMCNLRLKEDTQYETRLVAKQISEKMKELYPVSWEALVNV